jgi:hypothetical protein
MFTFPFLLPLSEPHRRIKKPQSYPLWRQTKKPWGLRVTHGFLSLDGKRESGVTGFKIKIKAEEVIKLIHHFVLKGHLNISPVACQGQS